jgi:uncharacterized protein (TIGR00369 family)
MSAWEDDRYCFACGEKNPIGMHLVFEVKEGGLEASYTFPKEFQGYKDTVHGGMLALLLDEVMVNLPWKKLKIPVVSVEMKVRLKKPAKVGDKITARAWILKEKSRAFIVAGEAINSAGEVVAEGESTCMKVDARLII